MAELKTADGSIFIYSHWTGYEMPETAKQAIKTARPRWDDEPYANRIIIDQLTKPGRDAETGFGIMLKPDAEDSYNNDEPSVIINIIKRTLTIFGDGAGEWKFEEL